MEKKKWITQLEVVDQETGEILGRMHVEKKLYRIIEREIKYTIENEYRKNETRVKCVTWICRANAEQFTLWD